VRREKGNWEEGTGNRKGGDVRREKRNWKRKVLIFFVALNHLITQSLNHFLKSLSPLKPLSLKKSYKDYLNFFKKSVFVI